MPLVNLRVATKESCRLTARQHVEVNVIPHMTSRCFASCTCLRCVNGEVEAWTRGVGFIDDKCTRLERHFVRNGNTIVRILNSPSLDKALWSESCILDEHLIEKKVEDTVPFMMRSLQVEVEEHARIVCHQAPEYIRESVQQSLIRLAMEDTDFGRMMLIRKHRTQLYDQALDVFVKYLSRYTDYYIPDLQHAIIRGVTVPAA